jgi:hypothetical protein
MLPKLTARPDPTTVASLRARFAELVTVDEHVEVRVAQYVPDPLIHVDDDGRAWLVAPVGRIPGLSPTSLLPGTTMHEVQRFARAGIAFHDLAVAHDLDPDGLVRHLVPQLLDGPRTCPDDVARALVGAVVPPQRASMADLAVRVAGFATGAAQKGVPPTVPRTRVVFGVIGTGPRLEPGGPALWVTLGVLEAASGGPYAG